MKYIIGKIDEQLLIYIKSATHLRRLPITEKGQVDYATLKE